jgi:hypothetical protein
MSWIFISYRRVDSEGYVGRLCDRLSQKFGPTAIFRDIDAIKPGENFVHSIDRALKNARAVIAVIGPRWLETLNQRLAQQAEDYVRYEISTALRKHLVIPVLVGQASMPGSGQLPNDLSELAFRNAVEISESRFDYDLDVLVKVLGGAHGMVVVSLVSRLGDGFTPFSSTSLNWNLVGYGTELHIFIDGKDMGKFEKGKDVLRFKVKEGMHRINISPSDKLYRPHLQSNKLVFQLQGGKTIFFRAWFKYHQLYRHYNLVLEPYHPIAQA